MKQTDLEKLVRPNILALEPYSCARSEFSGSASILLDANENPFNEPYNRYPDPLQGEIKDRLAPLKGCLPKNICLGNGSDETIDLVYRIFCRPGVDNVVSISPSYGMYKVCANTNDVEFREVELEAETYGLDAARLLAATDDHTKVVWLCSPNNPTGNLLKRSEVEKVLSQFHGIVVVDEAYNDFSGQESLVHSLALHSNLVVLQTFSKLWGCAGLRLGMAFASEEIIALMTKVKYPYNINCLTQRAALDVLNNTGRIEQWKSLLLQERDRLQEGLADTACITKVYASDANFILAKATDANNIYSYLVGKGIIVRNRNSVTLCHGCLRITVGSKQENDALLNALAQY